MRRTDSQRLAGVAVAIFYIVLWASAYVPSKIAAIESPALWFLVVRFFAAGAILAAVAALRGFAFPSSARAWISLAAIGILANAVYLGCTYTAMHRLSAGVGSIVASTNPLVLALVAPRLLGERLTPMKIAGLVLGFGGVVAIMIARIGTQTALPADVALSIVGVCASVASTILFKRLRERAHLAVVTAVQLLAASLSLVPLALLTEGVPHGAPGTAVVWSFVYLVLALSIGASLIWFWLLTHGEASTVTSFYYLTPVFGLGISAMLLGERVTAHDLVGLVAIAAGIALVQREGTRVVTPEHAT